MAINFPASPTEGQKLTQGGVVYTYTSGLWQAAPLGTALPFNYIVNPSMQVLQEYAKGSSVTGNGSFPADQWRISWSNSASPQCVIFGPSGFNIAANYLRFYAGSVVDASVGTTDYMNIRHQLEGNRIAGFNYGTSDAKSTVLRFKAATAIVGSLPISVALGNGNGRSWVSNVTLTTTLQEFVIAIPGDTAGTWVTGAEYGMGVSFVGMAGSYYVTPSPGVWTAGDYMGAPGIGNMFAVANTSILLTDVGLYLDPYKTGKAPPWELRNTHDATMESQRYWYRAYRGIGSSNTTTGVTRPAASHPVPMRIATPSLTAAGAIYVYDGTTNQTTTIATNFCNALTMEFNGASAGMVGNRAICFNNNAAGGTAGAIVNARL